MKYLNTILIDSESSDQTTVTSGAIDASQLYKMSTQIVVGSGTIDGSVQLQVSNDEIKAGYLMLEQPVNWTNLGSATALSSSGAVLVAPVDLCYRAIRMVYSNDNLLVNTITTVADVATSLNDTYWLLNTSGDNYYIWYNVDGGGTDPAVADRTGIEVAIAEDDTADDVASATRTALSAATEVVVSGATDQVITTETVAGTIVPAEDGAAPTGFTFADNSPTASITVQIMAFAV